MAMNVKQTLPRSSDFGADADEALEAAREMPPGPERIEALKAAGMLKNAADYIAWLGGKSVARQLFCRSNLRRLRRYRRGR